MLSKLRKNNRLAFERYKASILSLSKEEIFDESLKNFFYIAVNEYFNSCGVEQSFGSDDIAVLNELGEGLLDVLYDEYLSYEEFSVVTWSGIEKLLRNYLRDEDEDISFNIETGEFAF